MYFSNGTEGMIWTEKNCFDCAHLEDDGGCPVMDVHAILNYRQCDDKEIEAVLNDLINDKTRKCNLKITKQKLLDCNRCLIQRNKEP